MTGPGRRRAGGPRGSDRLAAAAGVATSVAVMADAVRLRGRWQALPVLGDGAPSVAGRPGGGPLAGDDADADAWVAVTAAGVRLDGATARAAVAHAAARELDVLELVPADVPPSRAIDVARRADRARLAEDPLAPALAAGYALVARAEVVRRAGLPATTGLDDQAMARAAQRCKQCASLTYDVAVAPGLAAAGPPWRPAGQCAAVFGTWASVAAAVRAGVWLAVAGAGAWALRRRARGAGLAMVATSVAPVVALAGRRRAVDGGAGPAAPGGLAGYTLGRPAVELVGSIRELARLRAETGGADPHGERRPAYRAALAAGTDRFFEARRPDCPWCGASTLEQVLSSRDHVQHKPGWFTLDRCRACGHVFQNPRLSGEGLAFYYSDFYDGIGSEQIEGVFGSLGVHYRRRAAMLQGHATPKRWLDVGTGHGHFCAVARQAWPGTAFDGLDLGAVVEDAERRGWVDRSYRGELVDVAPELAGTYDVVSMFHYLEHTTDPRRELDAAVSALAPGGHLMVEVPNPECAWGRLLGGLWMPWFQPQHLNLLPWRNLAAALEERGLDVVGKDLVGPHQPAELMFAAMFAAERLAPDPRLPWLGPPTPARRARRVGGMVVVMPAVAAGAAADAVCSAVLRTPRWANAYRLLARKRG